MAKEITDDDVNLYFYKVKIGELYYEGSIPAASRTDAEKAAKKMGVTLGDMAYRPKQKTKKVCP